jgi:diguanylate cyclase (GGDEF)-like protein/PAS domain S-box-containing protein
VRNGNGQNVWLDAVTTNSLDDPAVAGIVINARDVTERKLAESALRSSEERLRLALDAANMATWDMDLITGEIVRSEGMAALFGLPENTVIDPSTKLYDRLHPDDHDVLQEMDRRHLELGEPLDATFRVVMPDGEIRWIRERGGLREESDGVPRRLLGVTTDVTAHKRAEAKLQEAEARFRTLVEQIPAVTYVATVTAERREMRKTYVSPQIETLLGYTPEEWLARPELWQESVHPDDLARAFAVGEEAYATGQFQLTAKLRTKDGRWIWVRDQSLRTGTSDDGCEFWQGLMFDVSEERRAEEETRFQAELLTQVPAAVIRTDAAGNIMHWNRAAEELYGWTPDEAIGRQIVDLLEPGQTEEIRAAWPQDAIGRSTRPEEYEVRRKDGSRVSIHASAVTLHDDHGRISGIVGVSVDLTERKAIDERLRQMAYTDGVTGLANRVRFMERLELALNRLDERHGLAVLFMDLDRFKVVNDSLGHHAGDELLRMVGERLAGSIRPDDVLARFGGDEFALLCHPIGDIEQVERVAERILERLSAPFVIHGREVFINGSAGITIARDRDASAIELIRECDVAMYDAKALGRGQFALFDPAANERAVRRLAYETDLRHAIDRGELELHYQPIVDLRDGVVRGFEALIRWRHPEYGLISPADFVAIAEETGLIVSIGAWVIEEACRQAALWRAIRPNRPPTVSVNLSPRQLRGAEFDRTLWRALSDAGLPPELLNLEMTEIALSADQQATRQFLQTLKSIGVQLSLDDFGTGYSSLGRIHQLPLDVIKIDRSFVSGLHSETSSFAIVKAVTMLAHDLGHKVTAEGIETELQRRIATDLGCDYGQGFLFARAVPASEVPSVLAPRIVAFAAS